MKQVKSRIFIIEPNLSSRVGHSLEFIADSRSLLKTRGFEIVVIVNKNLPESILTDAKRMITNKCFERLESVGMEFLTDLQSINDLYKFKREDRVIIPTSYLNEIAGATKYGERHKVYPQFLLVIHQLYPPSDNFFKTHSFLSKRALEKKLYSLLATTNKNVKMFCTNSSGLKKKLDKNKNYSVKAIAFPFKKRESKATKVIYDLAFLGDNRFEKSLYLLTNYLVNNPDKKAFIQTVAPRGYPQKYIKMLDANLAVLGERSDTKIWAKELSKSEMGDAILKSKIIVLPYHPLSYKNRVSGLFPESIFAGKPMVASQDTWVGHQIIKNQLGTTFKFGRNLKNNVRNFGKAIEKLEKNYAVYQKNVSDIAEKYQLEYSYEEFFKKLEVLND